MKRATIIAMTTTVCAVMVACAMLQPMGPPKDGELALPEEYKYWPVFLMAVQKPDAVRDIYTNRIGTKASLGQQFPDRTVMVMEIYNPKKKPDGTFEQGPDGKLVKDKLAKIFVMEKQAGWAQDVSENLRTGSWVYSAFDGNGQPMQVNYSDCRACHVPLRAAKDWIHRYDEYFQTRGR